MVRETTCSPTTLTATVFSLQVSRPTKAGVTCGVGGVLANIRLGLRTWTSRHSPPAAFGRYQRHRRHPYWACDATYTNSWLQFHYGPGFFGTGRPFFQVGATTG